MKYWAFDLDGTLVDSFSHYFDVLRGIFKNRGTEFLDEYRHMSLTVPITELFEKHLGPTAIADAMTDLQTLCNQDALNIRTFSDILPVIQGLSKYGSRVAIWTNRDLVSAELIVGASGLKPYVDICVSGTCVQRKPDPAGLHRIAEHFGTTAEQVVVVGDHEHDIMGAKSAGALAVRASWHEYWPMEKCERADHQFFDVKEFASWVGKVCQSSR